jgi:hypothetical protein
MYSSIGANGSVEKRGTAESERQVLWTFASVGKVDLLFALDMKRPANLGASAIVCAPQADIRIG